VFGYFIEVSNAHRAAVPGDYQRRQTLTGGERYVTPALKEYEERVLTAAERIEVRERALFEALRARPARAAARLQRVAAGVAELDVLAALAEVAEREGYVRPDGHRRLRPRRRGRAAPGGRADDGARALHPQRPAPHRGRARGDPHRAQHGRQEHGAAPGGAHRAHGAGGELRAGARGPRWASSTGCSRASARATTSCAGRARSWSR
jgi:hypothetical protein